MDKWNGTYNNNVQISSGGYLNKSLVMREAVIPTETQWENHF